jgi:sn-glycerol 3-phosphate transport system permease protein
VAVLGIALSLVLAVFADRIIRVPWHKTLLVVPYAVAPTVAGVLGLHVFTSLGVVYAPSARWASTGTTCSDGGHAMALIVMAAVWKQISYNFLFFFLADCSRFPNR